MRELVCIVCPKGCRLCVDEENGYAVTGNACPRGAQYGRDECVAPTRTLTSTVRIEGAAHRRCPVKVTKPIPREKMFEAMRALNDITLTAPVARGQIVLRDLLGTGADVAATRAMPAVSPGGKTDCTAG